MRHRPGSSGKRPAGSSCTRAVSFERLVRCIEDLGGVNGELLTDRDTTFCEHGTDGPPFVPEWVDLCVLLGTVPRACRRINELLSTRSFKRNAERNSDQHAIALEFRSK